MENLIFVNYMTTINHNVRNFVIKISKFSYQSLHYYKSSNPIIYFQKLLATFQKQFLAIERTQIKRSIIQKRIFGIPYVSRACPFFPHIWPPLLLRFFRVISPLQLLVRVEYTGISSSAPGSHIYYTENSLQEQFVDQRWIEYWQVLSRVNDFVITSYITQHVARCLNQAKRNAFNLATTTTSEQHD